MSILGKSQKITYSGIMNSWNDPKYPLSLFPVVDFEIARSRLTAFRSPGEWLTIFEFIGFNREAGLCLNDVHAHGNRLRRNKHRFQDKVVDPPQGSPNYPFFETDELGKSIINPLDFEVQIKGKIKNFVLQPNDYKNLGIELEQTTIDPLTKILRYLCYRVPDALFLTNEEQMHHLQRPRGLNQFIQLYDWYHPDYRRGENIEDSPCLRSLARAISAGDPSMYDCPERIHNTHWSYWSD